MAQKGFEHHDVKFTAVILFYRGNKRMRSPDISRSAHGFVRAFFLSLAVSEECRLEVLQ